MTAHRAEIEHGDWLRIKYFLVVGYLGFVPKLSLSRVY